eukprot:jgi/Galph1/173/GphlegSOOS_G4978.1
MAFVQCPHISRSCGRTVRQFDYSFLGYKLRESFRSFSFLSSPWFRRFPLQASTSSKRNMSTKETLTKLPKLIPRKILFDNPKQTLPKVSPDGKFLAFLKPDEHNVLNVWVQPVESSERRKVTKDSYRGIRYFLWSEDSSSILYLQDKDGDEDFHLWTVNITDKNYENKDLTPFKGSKVQGVMTSKKSPNELLIGLNKRDRTCFDVYRVVLDKGEVVIDTENPGDILSWALDEDSMSVLGGTAMSSEDGSTIIRLRENSQSPWKVLMTFPYGEEGELVDFVPDKEHVYVRSSLDSDTTRLVLVNKHTGETVQTLASSERCNVGAVILHPDNKQLQAVSFMYARREWQFFDDAMKQDFNICQGKYADADLSFVSRDNSDTFWILSVTRDDRSLSYILFDRNSKRVTELFAERPELEEYELCKMTPFNIKARDGLEILSYLTRPKNITEPCPLVLFVHGGPWSRDTWGFNTTSQWFSNRGYACLQVNYRGSSGFGKAFLNAGDKQWGVGAMQNDLTDAVRWAIDEGIADPERVAIYGGSYGGYATLAGLVFTPELYCCGVDIVGPSNLKTLIESIPEYWKPMKKELLLRIGPADEDEEFNKKISPLFHVRRIRAPLLIAQGANDPRVKKRESDQIVSEMLGLGIFVEYVLYPDEGHGFARPENRMDFLGRAEVFLSKYLKGRCEPYEAIAGSTACLPIEQGLC